ncbi:MAG TPA: diguanylate cyclase [Gemmatimonadaceae bacterium]|nr:diguanylate cyclase [Gemmatimonadaceae bacterium]
MDLDSAADAAAPEHRRTRFALPRLDSIRGRILAFAVLATLVPCGITLGISYAQSRRALEAQLSQDLVSESGQTARAMGVWLKERLYDLRVFAGSEEVANTLGATGGSPAGRRRLTDYLLSLHERFGDFDRLMVLDADGRVLATSARTAAPVRLPRDWAQSLRRQGQMVGEAYWDASAHKGKLVVAVPVQRADGRLVGAFAAEVNLASMQGLLREFAHDSSGAIHLVDATDGSLLASSTGISARLMKSRLPSGVLERLAEREHAVLQFANVDGRQVVGTLDRVPQAEWAVVAELPADAAFKQLRRFRDVSLLVVTLLLVAVAASGYRFGRLIARPLDLLTQAAGEVAAGDLAVDLPEIERGEVGSLTAVFNHMVSRLREGRRELDAINETLRAKNEELERLSVTDGLTGLANHRFLLQRLKEEGVRSNRNNHPFSVLMADVDHFKNYNDTFGHPAGDEVLKKVGAIMRDAIRTMDCAARYGGEEFAIVLPETTVDGAQQVAERIRARIAAEDFPGRQITLSIGVAEFPTDADLPQAVIAVADAALYEAKRGGRDRVVAARRESVEAVSGKR